MKNKRNLSFIVKTVIFDRFIDKLIFFILKLLSV